MTNYQLHNLTSWHSGQWSKIYSLTSTIRYILSQGVKLDRKFWVDHRDLVLGCLNELQAVTPQTDKGSTQSLTRAINFLKSKQVTE